MRRCLYPGRLLRTGREPFSPLTPVLRDFTSCRCHIRNASSSNAALTGKVHAFIVSYNSYQKTSQDCLDWFDWYNPDAWMPVLSRCARPPRKPQEPSRPSGRRGSILRHKHDLDRIHTLMGHLWAAKKRTGVSLLAHLGFHRKQWSTVHALMSEFVDTYELLIPYMTVPDLGSVLDWTNPSMTLDQLTASTSVELKAKPVSSHAASLDNMTLQPVVNGLGERILAALLQHLGSVVLTAADHSPEESKLAMSCVFRILARLHKLGLISDRVYQFSPTDPGLLSCRPPTLHLLSGHIMTVLSEAAWQEHESALRAAAIDAGESPPFLPFQPGVRELGHEIWLELILWCCVEHGFAKQGARLVEEMTRRHGDQAWTVESWAPLLKSFDVIQETNISAEQSWRRPGWNDTERAFKSHNKPPFNGLGKRTISAEVVACLRSGLFNQAHNGVGLWGISLKDILKLSAPLTSLLGKGSAQDNLQETNRMTNWYMNRMLASGSLRPDEQPTTFGNLLQSTQDLVPPWEGDGIEDEPKLRSLTRAQIYDQTAAMAGLMEHNVKYHARQRRAGQAMHDFALLQNIFDASKVQHIQTFFQSQRESKSESKSADVLLFDDSRQLTSDIWKTSLPQVSVTTLADVLDLATGSRAYDFGNWLLFSDAITGPPIPTTVYGNQALAPAILRFAAATKDVKLCKKVIATVGTPLSVNLVKAVLNFHIAMEDWDRVELTLNYLRDYRMKGWGFSNITTLAAKIIRLHASSKSMPQAQEQDMSKTSLGRAESIFKEFYRKTFNHRPGRQRAFSNHQDTILLTASHLFETLPGPLGGLMEEAKYSPTKRTRTRLDVVPDSSFNQILAAVIDAHGSVAAWRVFTRWCLTTPSPARRIQSHGGVTRLRKRSERDIMQGDPDFDPEWFRTTQLNPIRPNFTTVRLMAQGAYKEFLETRQNATENGTSESTTPSYPPPTPNLFFLHPKDPRYKNPYVLDLPFAGAKTRKSISGDWPSCNAEAILDRCFCMFLGEKLTLDQIECELPGFVDRLYQRGLLPKEFMTGNYSWRVEQLDHDPWMQYVFKDRIVSEPAPEPAEQDLN